MSFREYITSVCSTDVNTSIVKLRDILCGKMSCRIPVLLQLEMTESTGSRFEFQGVKLSKDECAMDICE